MRNLEIDPEKTLNLLTGCNGLKTDRTCIPSAPVGFKPLNVLDPYRVLRF